MTPRERETRKLESEIGDGLADLIAAGRRRIAELQRRRQVIEREIGECSRKLRIWEAAQQSLVASADARGPQRHDPPKVREPVGRAPTKRQAVLSFLAEHPGEEFKLVEIRQALIARGWMESDQKSLHALEVAVIAMADREELERPRKGYYRLVPVALVDAKMNDRVSGPTDVLPLAS